MDQHYLVHRYSSRESSPVRYKDKDGLRAYDLNTPEGLFWKPIECYWSEKGVNNTLGHFDEFHLSLPWIALQLGPYNKNLRKDDARIAIFNFHTAQHLRTISYDTDLPIKHLVFKHNIFFTYLWDKDRNSLQLDILSVKFDGKELGGLKVTRRPKEVEFLPKRKDLNEINSNNFFFRSLLYISERNMIQLDDDGILFYHFF